MKSSNHQPQKSDLSFHEFQLFVAGNTIVSQRAIKNSHTLLDLYLKDNYKMELIDVYQDPEKIVEANIITTPTFIRKKPLPELMIIGDLSDIDKVAKELLLK
jgi:circadian clock protein KaiB